MSIGKTVSVGKSATRFYFQIWLFIFVLEQIKYFGAISVIARMTPDNCPGVCSNFIIVAGILPTIKFDKM